MKNNNSNDFVNKVSSQLCKLTDGKKDLRVGVAVSGGADSVSLLLSLAEIFCAKGKTIHVVTVNHNIRAAEETCGDALFVQDLCKHLNEKYSDDEKRVLIDFSLEELERGLVQKTADERGGGIEEAARFLRYEIFEAFVKKNHLDYLCLAHNRNDQYETLLMRFLQGSSIEGSCGIAAKRDFYIRPLLNLTRAEIEAFLVSMGQTWRIDSTNADVRYFRNNIRLQLVPFLNINFSGWENSVCAGAERISLDSDFIKSSAEMAYKGIEKDSYKLSEFLLLHSALQLRVLTKMCNNAGINSRIPFVFLQDVLKEINEKKEFYKFFAGIKISVTNEKVFVKKADKTQTDLSFFDIIEESGVYNFPCGQISVQQKENDKLDFFLDGFCVTLAAKLPVCIRNIQLADSIKCKDGSFKKVSDVYSDWHVSEELRPMLPLIQELKTCEQNIICIFGEPLGFYNWVVNEKVCK